ncbi:hypothetical protein COZ97_02990 [bacterium CG_4_8_14_3_um_filter_33_28]|nr:MAG: hypothetical protein COZ97_02990 [bacterium CG_4_8_14_3_um_filter_33_28]
MSKNNPPKAIKTIKVGPKDISFEEPFIVHLTTANNKIKDAEIELGFLHRGIEKIATRKNYYQNLGLVERICGYCSFTHSLAYVQAVENATEIKVPDRARYIRTIVAELERLHSHLLWADLVTDRLGFEPFSSHLSHIREGILDILMHVTGGRIMYEINTMGGILKDVGDIQPILKQIDYLDDIIKDVLNIFEKNKEVKENTKGLGILPREKAVYLGVVGPMARASGVKMDVRKDTPYAAYAETQSKNYIISNDCDSYARIYIRFLELQESLDIIKKACIDLPKGPISSQEGRIFPQIGEGIGRVEAPRGELFHYIITGSGDTPKRLKVKPPTYSNLPALKEMLIGEDKNKAQLIIASIDPCFSCTER